MTAFFALELCSFVSQNFCKDPTSEIDELMRTIRQSQKETAHGLKLWFSKRAEPVKFRLIRHKTLTPSTTVDRFNHLQQAWKEAMVF